MFPPDRRPERFRRRCAPPSPTGDPAIGAGAAAVAGRILPPVRSALLLSSLLLLAACAGPGEGPDVLDEEAAAALAQGADQLASALDDGDECAALAEADALVSRTSDGVEAGLVPGDVAAEVEAIADETTDGLECTADEPTDPDAPDEPGDDEPGDAPEDGDGPQDEDRPDGSLDAAPSGPRDAVRDRGAEL